MGIHPSLQKRVLRLLIFIGSKKQYFRVFLPAAHRFVVICLEQPTANCHCTATIKSIEITTEIRSNLLKIYQGKADTGHGYFLVTGRFLHALTRNG
jgi:hypothetical protein